MNIIHSVLLGIVEGVTEFLPVSSTGHLIVVSDLLGTTGDADTIFDVVIQSGAILAVCVAYFQRFWNVLRGLATNEPQARRFIMAVLLAFLPAAFLGAFLHDFIKGVLFSPYVVAASLILGGIAIMIAERFYRPLPAVHAVEDFSPALSLKIGLAQCLAMIPGVSRSGATIIGALLMGVERKTAAEFSFFLAVPTMLGATVYDLWKGRGTLTGGDITDIVIGFVVSFIVALLVIRWFVRFVSTHGFIPFAWYRIVFGFAVLAWLHFQGA